MKTLLCITFSLFCPLIWTLPWTFNLNFLCKKSYDSNVILRNWNAICYINECQYGGGKMLSKFVGCRVNVRLELPVPIHFIIQRIKLKALILILYIYICLNKQLPLGLVCFNSATSTAFGQNSYWGFLCSWASLFPITSINIFSFLVIFPFILKPYGWDLKFILHFHFILVPKLSILFSFGP